MTNNYRRPRQFQPISGFTLVELLIAMSITGLVITLAGTGLVAIMQANQKSESETFRRTTLNRALDFISDDIRMAKAVGSPASASVPTPSCGTATGVLELTMPDNSRIVYYVNNISSCSSSNSGGWAGPATIRRVISGTDTLLVDAITAPTSSSSCSGTSTGGNGFTACINNRLTTLSLSGKVTNAYNQAQTPITVTSNVAARSQ